jgi:cytochrome c oxidase subunit 3
LSGLHGLHIVSAIIVLIFALVSAFKLDIHAKKLNQIEMCVTYWHFLDLLWLYLFFFLLYNN